MVRNYIESKAELCFMIEDLIYSTNTLNLKAELSFMLRQVLYEANVR